MDLDDGRAAKMFDEAGMINKEEFTQLAKHTHLLDFESTTGTSPMALLSPRKTRKQPQTLKKGQNRITEDNLLFSLLLHIQSCPSMLACFCSDNKMLTEVREKQMGKVELAFRKFDLDGDGFLSWEEF